MPDDLKARLTKMAAEAQDPADRQWAAAKLAAKFGGATEAPPVPPAEPGALGLTPPAPNAVNEEDYAGLPDSDLQVAAAKDPRGAVGKALGTMAGTGIGLAGMGLGAGLALPARLAMGAITGGAAGAGQGATEAAVSGQPVAPAAKQGFGVGALTGLGMEAGGSLLGGISRLVRRASPTIGRYAAASDAGAYQDPAMQALPGGAEGNRAAAEAGLGRVVARDQQLGKEAGARYAARVDPARGLPVDRGALRGELKDAVVANLDPDTGLPLRENVDRALQSQLDRTGSNPTVGGTLARRRALQQDAAFGNPAPTSEQQAAREAYGAFRRGIRRASPEVAAADDEFAKHAIQAARRHDILGNTESEIVRGGGDLPEPSPDKLLPEDLAGPTMRVGKERAAATTLARVNDTNVPGLSARRYIEELAAQDPQIAEAIRFVANKKDFEATRFSLEGLQPLSLHGATEAGGMGHIIRQNARAIGGRILDPAAATGSQALRLAEPFAAPLPGRMGFDQEYAAAQEQRRKRKP